MPHRRAVGNAGAGGTGRTGPSARLWGGCAPHAPIPEEHALRAARPTHPPSDVLSVGAPPPRPRPDQPVRGLRRRTEPPAPSRERAGMRGAPRASAARWSRTPRSDRRRENAPRLPERLPRGSASIGTQDTSHGPRPHPGGGSGPPARPGFFLHVGAVSIGTRGYLAGPPRPRPNDGASLAIPYCSLLLLASRGSRTALAPCTEGAQRPVPQALRKGLPGRELA